jgi:peptidoglycan/LPS O-acetylase OafA/YrhL
MQPARAGAPSHGTIRSVQIMRGLAAFMVVAHHCAWKGQQYSTDPWRGFRAGEAGVDLFFVISGFIMCEATNRRPIGFGAFLKARALRILPLYWLLSLVALACWRIAPQWVNSKGGDTVVLESFLLLPTTGLYLIQNGWTLSYEFLFYAIFALGLLWRGAARHALPFALLVLLASAGLLWRPASLAGQFFTHASLFEFAMGAG